VRLLAATHQTLQFGNLRLRSLARRKAAAFATFARYLDLSKTFALAVAAAEEGQ
jgi:hypothetical protein